MKNKMQTLSGLIEQSLLRTQEATLGVLDIANDGLRQFIRQQISLELGSENCFLADPVVEHTFGWETGEYSFKDLSQTKGGRIFSNELIELLGNKETPEAYRFGGDIKPYKHQIKAWKTLTEKEIKSTIITSGTGSGKTECFMLPILDSLIRQQEATQKTLVGVQALFLYPLNALINSQRERLDAWTRQFGKDIRFCLYNGNTEEKERNVKKQQKDNPNQILSRELLRREPSPILMTNATMLEYMLVRQADFPILEKSRKNKSLRWIVLDEAHTYIGSQAAEISLLLRRVIQAFDKKPEDIRFIATSATISTQDGVEKLQTYLAELAGVSPQQVEVISGKRMFDEIPVGIERQSINEIKSIESEEHYQALMQNKIAGTIRETLVKNDTPLRLNQLVSKCDKLLASPSIEKKQREVLAWLDLMSQTQDPKTNTLFLKLRLHLFQKMFHGLWVCVDSNCQYKSTILNKWCFGQVYLHQRDRCQCGAPVCELALCYDCNEPHLQAEDINGVLKQRTTKIEDEFSLVIDNDEELEDDEQTENKIFSEKALVLSDNSKANENYISQSLNKQTAEIGTADGEVTISFAPATSACCSRCGKENKKHEFHRSLHLGAPFYITNVVPTVLEFCPEDKKNISNPAEGRKLITFTDSRQGTARMAVKMQQEAERNKLRGLVFEILVNLSGTNDNHKIRELQETKNLLEAQNSSALMPLIDDYKKQIEEAMQPTIISWKEMVEQLSSKDTIEHHILEYNKDINPQVFGDKSGNGSYILAKLLLAREFRRRPKLANSMESLGLVSVTYPRLSEIKEIPDYWAKTKVMPFAENADKNLDLNDWRAFLKMLLDFYVRENSFIKMEQQMKNWLGAKFYAKSFLPPKSDKQGVGRQTWPLLKKAGNNSRPIKILQAVIGFDLKNTLTQDQVNLWLETAWEQLTSVKILQSDGDSWSLPLEQLAFSLPQQAWRCPVTDSLIDNTFRGISPYLPRDYNDRPKDFFCHQVTLPNYSKFQHEASNVSRLEQIRDLLSQDSMVNRLREDNLWGNLHDRVIEGGFYYRSAEHSAQQNAKRLENYESKFKTGKINVLSCSTTMEMGVDIGGISAVVMNNVPPHPANYLQRSGRAGRRNEATAVAYTLCKPDPHNQRVFKNTLWPFVHTINAPKVSLSSEKIVARHVNSLLLASFLQQYENKTDNLKLTTAWLFNVRDGIYENFCDWINDNSDTEVATQRLIQGSVLQNKTIDQINKAAIEKIQHLAEIWQAELRKINNKINKAESDYKKALEKELRSHEEEYLLRYLAVNAFLPGYGFPTDVVNINISKREDWNTKNKSREDNLFQYKESPSRSLDIALREYAPGSQIVIDGRVYRSAGVNLRVKSDGKGKNEAQNFDISWRCKHCGTAGIASYAYTNAESLSCYRCDEIIPANEQRTVLIPKGFLTDFYDDTTNDISTQKFIKTEMPLVQLNGSRVSLPQACCGFVHHGHEGEVFYHSSGENGKGYALCLSCGRSDSMTKDGELPAWAKKEEHRSLGGGSQVASVKEDCSCEAIKENIYLGYHFKTEVVEFAIQNPKTSKWLDDEVIARTLAVAIRDEVADRLGIDSTEMGYASRIELDSDSKTPRHLIQIYDNVSGGADFCLSAIENISDVLEEAFKRLECSMNCDSICSHCLSANDSNVERDNLNRKQALEWLNESDFKAYLSIPENMKNLSCHYSALSTLQLIERCLRGKQNHKVNIYFNHHANIGCVSSPDTFKKLHEWKFSYGANVALCFPKNMLNDKEIQELLRPFVYAKFGIFSYEENVSNNVYTTAQITSDNQVESFFSEHEVTIFDEGEFSTYTTKEASRLTCTVVNTSNWYQQKSVSSVHINHELDGSLVEFGTRFIRLLESETTIKSHLQNRKLRAVCYTDRYLKSPLTILLLSRILQSLISEEVEKISIKTLGGRPTYKRSEKVWDDWQINGTQKEVYTQWFKTKTKEIDVKILENTSNIPHGRSLELFWEGGGKTTILFDQGMGYWNRSDFLKSHARLRFFPFNSSVDEQINHLIFCLKSETIRISTSHNWASYIMLYDE